MGPRVWRRGAIGRNGLEGTSAVHMSQIGLASQPLNEHNGRLEAGLRLKRPRAYSFSDLSVRHGHALLTASVKTHSLTTSFEGSSLVLVKLERRNIDAQGHGHEIPDGILTHNHVDIGYAHEFHGRCACRGECGSLDHYGNKRSATALLRFALL